MQQRKDIAKSGKYLLSVNENNGIKYLVIRHWTRGRPLAITIVNIDDLLALKRLVDYINTNEKVKNYISKATVEEIEEL